MYEAELFLGFPIDALFAGKLAEANPNLVTHFIQGSEDYLNEVEHNHMRFLGKNLGNIATLSLLELKEANIYSLLKKLVPDFPYNETPLYLFPLKKDS